MQVTHYIHALPLGVVSLGLLGAYMHQALNFKGTQTSSISLILKHNQFREYVAQTSWFPSVYLFVRCRHLQGYGTLCPLVRLFSFNFGNILYCNGHWENPVSHGGDGAWETVSSFGVDIS